MLGNLPLAVISCPSGVFTYVGRIPSELCKSRKPTISDIMGGRVAKDGKVYSSLLFLTEKGAIEYAKRRGFIVSLPTRRNHE